MPECVTGFICAWLKEFYSVLKSDLAYRHDEVAVLASIDWIERSSVQ